MNWRTGNKHAVTHGKSHSLTYHSWVAMRTRCLNPTYKWYKWHGGKGVRICERWNDFNNFLADMGERPPGRSLDRIDNNGNYELGNCRWATKEVQGRNRSTVKLKVADVERIRDMISCGCKNTHIAKYFGVHRITVFDIRAQRTWR